MRFIIWHRSPERYGNFWIWRRQLEGVGGRYPGRLGTRGWPGV